MLFRKRQSNLKNQQAQTNHLAGLLNLVGGSGASQIILLLTMPAISYLYSPSDFGVFAIFTSFLTILIPFATLRFEKAVCLCEETALCRFSTF